MAMGHALDFSARKKTGASGFIKTKRSGALRRGGGGEERRRSIGLWQAGSGMVWRGLLDLKPRFVGGGLTADQSATNFRLKGIDVDVDAVHA